VSEPLLVLDGLVKRFGGLIATNNVSLSIEQAEVHAIIGPNGAGKTTLVSQIVGEQVPNEGSIRFEGRDVTHMPVPERARRGIARSFQITSIFDDLTVRQNVSLAVQARDGHSFRFWQEADRDTALLDPANEILDLLGLESLADRDAANLAHGDKRALEIAMALAMKPRLLLLDEPMAGMAPEDSKKMVRLLASLKGKYTLLLVEHDMDAVFALSDRISVLVYGAVIATGAPAEIRASKAVRDAYLGEHEVSHA